MLFTIGHSNHSLDKLVRLLNENGVMILVDVRSAPYSRYSPHFNKDNLAIELPRANIHYDFAGQYLGGRPKDPGCYKNQVIPAEGTDYLHQVDYPAVMKRPWFIKAINQLLQISEQDLTAIMCSEEDPARCHRHHLIAKYILENHPEVQVQHIRGDGATYSAQSIVKSLDDPKGNQLSMF